MSEQDVAKPQTTDTENGQPELAAEANTEPSPEQLAEQRREQFATRLAARGHTERRLDPALAAALGDPMKPFVLWDVAREELDPGRLRAEHYECSTLLVRRGRPPLPRLRPVCSRELERFVPASRLAQRAHTALRAALRLLLRQPIVPADDSAAR
ncbi:MAG: hypothetical protein D6776_03455 [Planctomycetota bacterium]|nr:MAG: hypothetical protein D6776_03455 [Planctomycetota bacterium]